VKGVHLFFDGFVERMYGVVVSSISLVFRKIAGAILKQKAGIFCGYKNVQPQIPENYFFCSVGRKYIFLPLSTSDFSALHD
jgi:hypothetical protein